jgi:catechol 2,3-dioxygenase-like lactoylglutathione lyase family enzyme
MIAIPPGGEMRAREFYCDLLELEEIPKPDSLSDRGGLWLSTGSLAIHLGADPDFRFGRKAHIAIEYDYLDYLISQFDYHEIATGPIERDIPGYRRCYVTDPFGNRIELMQAE